MILTILKLSINQTRRIKDGFIRPTPRGRPQFAFIIVIFNPNPRVNPNPRSNPNPRHLKPVA